MRCRCVTMQHLGPVSDTSACLLLSYGRSASSTRGNPYLAWPVQAHPHLPVLATSGIEPTIKVWSPGEERLPDPLELVQSMKRNQVLSQLMPLHALSCMRFASRSALVEMHAWVSVCSTQVHCDAAALCSDESNSASGCLQERVTEGPQLLPGINPSLLVRLSERPELLNMLLMRAAAGQGEEGEEGRPEVACRMA